MENLAIIIGRCGMDAEIRPTAGGGQVAVFRLVSWRSWGTGEARQRRETWHNIAIHGALGKLVCTWSLKGRLAEVRGRIENSTFERLIAGTTVTMHRSEVVVDLDGAFHLLDQRHEG